MKWQGCQPYALAAFNPQEIFLVLISVRGCLPQDHSAAGMIKSLKNPNAPSGLEPATSWFVAQCLNQLSHRVPAVNNRS